MSVCPYPREDGFWLIERGDARFVPFVKTPAPAETVPAVAPERGAQILFFTGPRREIPPANDWYFEGRP